VITSSQDVLADDCKKPFAQVAARVAKGSSDPSRVVVARLRFSWEPWQIRVKLAQLSGAISSGEIKAPDVVLPIPSVELPLGAESVSLVPILYFHGSDSTVLLAEENALLKSRVKRAEDIPPLAAIVSGGMIKRADEDFVVRIGDGLSSRLVTRLAGNGGLAIETGDATVGRITLSEPTVSTKAQSLRVAATATIASGDRYRATIGLAGAVLSVDHLAVEQLTPCASDDIACQLKATLAPALAAVVTSAYKGKPLHTMLQTAAIPVRAGTVAFDIYPVVTRLRAQAGELQVLGRLIFERPSTAQQPEGQHVPR
jgi:hypothetical protein